MAEYDSYSAITYDEAQTALSTGKTEFLHDWLTTVVQEDGAYSDKAAQLLNRMDSLCCTSELEQETTPPEIPEPEEASFRVSSMYLHIQRASDDSWDYTLYDSQLAEIDGGQVGDASMTFAQAKADTCRITIFRTLNRRRFLSISLRICWRKGNRVCTVRSILFL